VGKVIVEGIRLYAHHGCMEEETRLGGNYRVDVWVDGDFSKAAESDAISDAVDYVEIYEIVKKEMAIPSKLIETVAKRIGDGIKKKYPALKGGEVKVVKLNAPIGGVVDNVAVVYAF
jgi:7,8-dihydroneopterin aldolase/epimerase/oxygenase